ncbi:MAG: hypothetical protein WHW07_00370 [Bacteroidales bacterium]
MKNNKLIFGIVLLLIMTFQISKADELVFKGVYQGKDLFIINPMIDIGEEYCAYEILVNNIKYDDEIRSSAFKISLDFLNLKYGEEFEVVIKHRSDCTPKLVNPEVLKPLSTYEIINYELGYNDLLRFTTTNESGKLTFYVEEYRWNRWIERGRIMGEGGPGNRNYSVKIYPFAGENKFRVYQIDHLGRRHYSEEFVFNIDKEPVKVMTKLSKVGKEIVFSGLTAYAVVNDFGEELITGVGTSIDVSNLKKGQYFLNFENEYVVFKKK